MKCVCVEFQEEEEEWLCSGHHIDSQLAISATKAPSRLTQAQVRMFSSGQILKPNASQRVVLENHNSNILLRTRSDLNWI
jgi:hypothetical protein